MVNGHDNNSTEQNRSYVVPILGGIRSDELDDSTTIYKQKRTTFKTSKTILVFSPPRLHFVPTPSHLITYAIQRVRTFRPQVNCPSSVTSRRTSVRCSSERTTTSTGSDTTRRRRRTVRDRPGPSRGGGSSTPRAARPGWRGTRRSK